MSTLGEIVSKVDGLKIEIEKGKKKTTRDKMDDMLVSVQQMNWHNDTIRRLKDLDKCKSPFYKTVREYF